MKRYLAAILMFIACNAGAQSKLRVSLLDNSRISIEVDYNHFRKIGTSITVDNMPEGRHQLRIFEERNNAFGRPVHDLIYEGRVKTKSGNITIFELDPESGATNVYDEDIDSFNSNPTISPSSNGGDQLNNVNASNNYSAGQHPNPTLTAEKMKTMKGIVDAHDADSRKITDLKDALVGEKISTDQVATMMSWLGFESTREEFAEWAYDIVVDKENYNTLDTKFNYEEYKEMFDNFMKKH